MNVGIIGTGYISTFHAKAYNDAGAHIAAVSDINEANYLSRKELYGSAKYYQDYHDLLADPSIDAVSICVTNKLHYEIVKDAVCANKHIFCEKTLTESQTKSQELASILTDYPKNFQIGYMKRFFPATIKAMELLPQIGEIWSAYVKSYQGFEWDADIYDNDGWRPKDGKESQARSFASGGMLNMAGSHMLDLLNLFMGTPTKIYSANWSPADYDAEMSSHALFTMPNDAIVHFEACCSPYSRGGLRQDGWDEKIELCGKRGRIEIFYVIWDKPLNNAPLLRVYMEDQQAYTEYTFPKVDAFSEQIKAFVANCAAGVRSLPGVAEGLTVDTIIEKCYESAKSGLPVIV